jgi:hypothetical protein
VGELRPERVGGGLPTCAAVLAAADAAPCRASAKPREERSSERAKEHQGTIANATQKKRERSAS